MNVNRYVSTAKSAKLLFPGNIGFKFLELYDFIAENPFLKIFIVF